MFGQRTPKPNVKKIGKISVWDSVIVGGIGEPTIGSVIGQRRFSGAGYRNGSSVINGAKAVNNVKHRGECYVEVPCLLCRQSIFGKIPYHWERLPRKEMPDLCLRTFPSTQCVLNIRQSTNGKTQHITDERVRSVG